MERYPEVYLIGAQKAGTTTLADLLNQHPDIEVSNPKETHYFSQKYNKTLKWYLEHFTNNDKVKVDASTSYTMGAVNRKNALNYNAVPERIHTVNPNAKFIYILRNPVDRTYSGYWHSVKAGRERREFNTLIQDDTYFHLEISKYYEQIKRYLKYFELNQFLFLRFDDLKLNPKETINKCYEFMDVKPYMDIDSGTHMNQSYIPSKLGLLKNFLGYRTKVLKYISPIIPFGVKRMLRKKYVKKNQVPEMSEDTYKYLTNYFVEHNNKLSELADIDLSDWNYIE